tara:strand:- start:15 stop:179 length:165 start_codon:yes stop_codon:yes gene_type:complete
MRAETENTKPTAWANLLGGPGTGLFIPMRGANIRVASSPARLILGPAKTLAKNP